MPSEVPPEFRVLPDADALADFAAERVAARVRRAVASRGRCDLVLAGGSTPERAYTLLAHRYAVELPWDAVHFWFGDERCVAPDDPGSNHAMARRTLLDAIRAPAENVHRIRAEMTPQRDAAVEYEARLMGQWPGTAAPGFDLVLLGVGADGHTASLFPGHAALVEKRKWVLPVEAAATPRHRITLTLPALRGAREIAFLVSGASKRPVVEAVRADPRAASDRFPAAAVRAATVAWWLDAAAAGGAG